MLASVFLAAWILWQQPFTVECTRQTREAVPKCHFLPLTEAPTVKGGPFATVNACALEITPPGFSLRAPALFAAPEHPMRVTKMLTACRPEGDVPQSLVQ